MSYYGRQIWTVRWWLLLVYTVAGVITYLLR